MEYVKEITADEKSQKEIREELDQYKRANLITQSELGRISTHKAATFEKALNILGDVVDHQELEIEALKEKIGDQLDQNLIDSKIKIKQKNSSNIERNKRILRAIARHTNNMKKLTNN